MATANPYAADLGDRVPLEALAETPEKLRRLVAAWSDEDFERTYAAGKWSFRKMLVHLAQTELALTTRARFALSQADYLAQAFSQDDWMAIDNAAGARVALDTYTTLRQFNLAMWRALTPEQTGRLGPPASRRGKTSPPRLLLTMASAARVITTPVNNQLDNEAT